MTKEEIIYAATFAHSKKYDYEAMMYSDTMYGNEDCMENVWDYVTEINELGVKAFKEKYNNINLYWNF
jgi:hypothetical protein